MKAYILLQKHKGFFPKYYEKLSGSNFSHASISIDPTIAEFFSFRMKWGFCSEHPFDFEKKHKEDIICALYSVTLSESEFEKLKVNLEAFNQQREVYHYSFLSLILGFFKIRHRLPRGYYCSRFVAEVVTKSMDRKLKRHASVYLPGDFMFENFKLKFLGKAKDYLSI